MRNKEILGIATLFNFIPLLVILTAFKLRNKILKYTFKTIKWILYSLVIVLVLLYLFLRLSSVQTYLGHKLANYASRKSGMQISIGSVDISGLLKIELRAIKARDKHDSLFVDSKSISLQIIPAYLYNNIFYVKRLNIDSSHFALVEYKGENEFNLMKLINVFTSSSNSDSSSTPFIFRMKQMKITNSSFGLDIQNMDHFEGMDYTHLTVDSINMLVEDFKMSNDSIMVNIRNLSAYEKCGFNLKSLVGQVLISSSEIDIPNLFFNANNTTAYSHLRLQYNQWSDWLDFVDKVRFNTQLDSSRIYLDDLKFFAPSMQGMKDRIIASGKIRGSVSNLNLSKAHFYYGNRTYFNGSLSMNGLPNIDQTFLRFRVKKAAINTKELSRFKMPGGQKLSINTLFNKLGNVYVKGRFTGFYYDFVSEANFKTALGSFSTDISLQPTTDKKNIRYKGTISADKFDLGSFVGTNYFGRLSLHANIDGEGLNADLKAKYNIDIQHVILSGNPYQAMKIEGDIANRRITTKLNLSNNKFSLFADGFFDYSDSLPHLFMFSRMRNARVNRFFLIPEDTLGRLTTIVSMDVYGNTLDNAHGKIEMDSLDYSYKNEHFIADSINLALNVTGIKHQFSFNSPFVQADFGGFNKFSDVSNMFNQLFTNIIPNSMGKAENKGVKSNRYTNVNDSLLASEQFSFNIDFIKIAKINKAFFPSIQLGDGSNIMGYYNFMSDSLNLSLHSPAVVYQHFNVKDIDMVLHKANNSINYAITSNQFITPTEIYVDSLSLNGSINRDTLDFNFLWGGRLDTKNRGLMNGRMVWNDTNNISATINKAHFYVNDSLWQMKPNARFNYYWHHFEVKDLEIKSGENSVYINGLITDNTHDILSMTFNKFDVSFLDFYTRKWDTDLDGFINGKMELSSLWKQPGFISNFIINDFKFNKTDFSSLKLNTLYSRSRQAIVFDVNTLDKKTAIKNIDLGGFYYPYRTNNQLDFELRVAHFPLKSIRNYLTSFSSEIKGTADGRLKIKGSLNKPLILGFLNTKIDDILIDYTRVHYKIYDKLIFTPKYFGFINANAKDIDGNDLKLTAQIFHKYFSDISFNIDVKPMGAKLLNTKSNDNELFYGKANGKGFFKLKGNAKALDISMNLTPVGKSKISIPISTQSSAEEIDFLSFVVKDSSAIKQQPSKVDDALKLKMDMFLNITPQTEIQLVMDKKVGDIISANGKGKMHLLYDTDGSFGIYGKYIIDNGNYLFTMQDVINKRFTIDPGSEITWDGKMDDAKINLKAVYHVDAKLWDLLQQLDSTEAEKYKKLSKVDCIINLDGSLYNPDISFDIKLPDESIATRELVNQMISPEATGNNEELNKNFVSLLVLGRFMPPSGYESGANPNVLTHNTYEMLAEQLGNILNNMIDQVEIGVDWNPGDNLTTQEVAVALSYSALDDRLIIDGKFGAGGGSRQAGARERIVGDVKVEYKLTKDGRIRAKVFNRTNYYDPLTRKAPYTQGIGISYRKDFNSFKELFTSRSKKQAKQKKKKEGVALDKNNME